MSRSRASLAILTCLLAVYLVVSLRHLAVVPPVYEDEPWQASTALKLARQGVFGSDVFAGLHGMERRYYGYMPVHPVLLAVTFRMAGFGLLQARLEPVVMGLLVLLLTYALGARLFGPSVGVLAVALLLSARLTGLTRSQPTGILLLDIARIARYDMVVPIFGLASLHVYLWARVRPSWPRYLGVGILAALAGLSHLYGAFWIVALGILALWDGARVWALGAIALGFVIPWVGYLGYVLADVPAWVGQTRGYAPRFDLLNLRWYWSNLLHEPRRYGPGLGPLGWGYLLRPTFWAAVLAVPAALLGLAVLAKRDGDRAARAILVPALVLPTLFGLLIYLKLANYLVTIAPVVAIAVAWGGVSVWRWAESANRGRLTRAALLGLLLLVAAEGATRIAALERTATATTPYADFIGRVRAHIPPGSRVLGLHNYWFGLDDLEYRSWLVPLGQVDEASGPPAVAMDAALDRIAPDVILVDPRLRAYFDHADASDPKPRLVVDWMARRGYVRTAIVDDATYGAMHIFRHRP